MKIKQKDFDLLKEKMDAFFKSAYPDEPVHTYEHGKFPRADKVKDLQKRFCFDMLHYAKIKIGDGVGVQGDINLYAYMNDEHIYTALKAICPKVVKRY